MFIKILADENIPYVKDAFGGLGAVTTCTGRDIGAADIKDIDILLVRSVTNVNKRLLENSNIKFVASATAGLNHIDLDYLTESNIAFAHAPGSNAISAAEYVMSGISLWALQEKKDLSSLSIGIIGRGAVGSKVLEFSQALGLRCVANDPPLAESGVTNLGTLEEALSCDIVTFHVPLTFNGNYPTHHLLNAERLNFLSPQTLLINAARGGVVEEAPLLERLELKNDLSLILDVWENEPDINLQLLEKTLIGTPHIAGYSLDGKIRGTEMIYRSCCEFLGVESSWSVQDLELPEGKKHTNDSNPLQQILSAYDIRLDSKQLKLMLNNETLQSGSYFDQLRKDYPARREFLQKLNQNSFN